MDWFYLALIAPLFWSIVVLIDDNLVRNVYKGPYFGSMVSGLFGALPLVSLLWMDQGSISPGVMLSGIAAGFFTVLYYFYYFKALERESPSIVIALFSLTPITLPFLANIFLGETLTQRQILGFILVVLASFVLAATDIKKFKFSKALPVIVVAALLYDVASLAAKYTYDHTDFYTGYMCFALGMGLGGFYYLYTLLYLGKSRSVKDIFKKNGLLLVLILTVSELINIAAEFVQKLAISKGPVSLVKAVENVQPIYLLLIALLLYPFFPKYFREAKEGHVKFKMFIMIILVAGVTLAVI